VGRAAGQGHPPLRGVRDDGRSGYGARLLRAGARAGLAQGLGPDWRRDDFRHAHSDRTRIQTWSYLTHCPDTLVDLHYATSAAGPSTVTIEMTQYSCRDGFIEVIVINLFPFFRR